MQLGEATEALRQRGRKALVAFFTAGYPDEETFLSSLREAGRAGCDLIEVGVPFSDPIADGPVIQAASTAALRKGMTLSGALELCSLVHREISPPLVVMSYINPLLAMGVGEFARRAASSGVIGVILPDVSHEESGPLRATLRGNGLTTVDLLAPTSSTDRVRTIASSAEGFLYLVSVTGVTGSRHAVHAELAAFVDRVRAEAKIPLYVGFGISSAEEAADIARVADGVIIGSRLLRLLGSDPNGPKRVGAFLAEVRAALDGIE